MSSILTVSLYGESYHQIYNTYTLKQSRFQNTIGDYSFNESVDGYNFKKKNFVICKKDYIHIKTIRGNDTINYVRKRDKSFIITNGKKIPIRNRVNHWTNIELPEQGKIIDETMIYNVRCYHVISGMMELWIDKEDNIPVMILYKGNVNVKVIISQYMEIDKGLVFPTECTIFVNNKFYCKNSIWNFKYTGG